MTRKKYYYSWQSGYKASSFKLTSHSDRIVIAGTRFQAREDQSLDSMNKQMVEYIQATLWFSYKYNWAMFIPDTKLDNDIGWGCMIRCGQMLLAKAIARKTQKFDNECKKDVIELFNDSHGGESIPFSIHNIVKFAAKNYNVTPGQWFRATTIMMSLDALNNQYNPKLTSSIVIFTSVDSLVTLTDVYKKVFATTKVSPETNPLEELKNVTWKRHLLFSVAIRTGLAKPQANFKKTLARIMETPQSLGILGGKDNKAYYILGNHNLIKATTRPKRNTTILTPI